MIKILYIVISLFLNYPENEEYITKIYNIQDLESTLPNFTNAPTFDLQSALNNQGSLFTNSTNAPFSTVKDYQSVIDIIQSNIEPDVWLDGATIKYWHGNLIIRAPQRIHDQLQ